MNEPELVSCSWLPDRELMGRGRVGHVQLGIPQGTFVQLDQGKLDLGLVRDSTLNATNDFQVFGEAFASLEGMRFGDGLPPRV